jgi:replication-associated recombination protein RarA
MVFGKSKLGMLLFRQAGRYDGLFRNIYGCDNIKRLLMMTLESNHASSILLAGPPASAKTLFLQSLMKLKDSHFIDCNGATKSGIVDYIFDNKPKYLLLDEIDKLSRKDQTFLLNMIETGIVSETKYGRTRRMEIKTSVFATSNDVEKIMEPLQSRFFIVNLQAYTYEQFYEITIRLLTSDRHNVNEEIAKATADAVWNTSRNIRDCTKIAKMVKSSEDADWLVTTFLKDNDTEPLCSGKVATFSNKFPEYSKDLETTQNICIETSNNRVDTGIFVRRFL